MNVKQWIASGKPYKTGIDLFKKLNGSSTLLTYFLAGENSLSKKKLHQELLALAETPSPSDPVKETENQFNAPKVAEAAKSAKKQIVIADLPNEVRHVNNLRLETFKKMAALHQAMCAIEGNGQKAIDKRYELMVQIKQLDRTNTHCWEQLKYYAEHNSLPPEAGEFNPKNLTIRELVNLEKTIPTYITKERKKLQQPIDSDKIEAINQTILKLELQLTQVKDIINSLPKLNEMPC